MRILCSLTLLFENLALYEIMSKNTVQPDKPQMTIHMVHAPLCILDDKGYIQAILIAFPRQQWLRERFLMLSYTYVAYLVTPDFPLVMMQWENIRSCCQSKIHESRKILLSSEEFWLSLPICNTSNDTFNWINQPDAANSHVYYLSFKYSSKCFAHPHAHHQELQQLQ